MLIYLISNWLSVLTSESSLRNWCFFKLVYPKPIRFPIVSLVKHVSFSDFRFSPIVGIPQSSGGKAQWAMNRMNLHQQGAAGVKAVLKMLEFWRFIGTHVWSTSIWHPTILKSLQNRPPAPRFLRKMWESQQTSPCPSCPPTRNCNNCRSRFALGGLNCLRCLDSARWWFWGQSLGWTWGSYAKRACLRWISWSQVVAVQGPEMVVINGDDQLFDFHFKVEQRLAVVESPQLYTAFQCISSSLHLETDPGFQN